LPARAADLDAQLLPFRAATGERRRSKMMGVLASLENSAFSMWLLGSDSVWAFPTVLTVHTLGVMLLAGASTAVGLRLLGVAREIPLDSLRPLFTVIWTGFGVNLVTGVMLFVADATRKATMPLFYFKLLVVAGGVASVWLARREVSMGGGTGPAVSARGRSLAIVSIVCWTAAMAAGRLLAYVN
jgi:hypothetical protein